MKTIRTLRGWEAVTVGEGDDAVTIGRVPLSVSNAEADRLEKAAAELNVSVVVEETDGDDTDGNAPSGVTPTPDLSAGVSAVTGQGDAVVTDDSGETTTTKRRRSGSATSEES